MFFCVAWLALARTEEIVIAAGQLEPIDSVQNIQMPVGGVADQILVKEGDRDGWSSADEAGYRSQ